MGTKILSVQSAWMRKALRSGRVSLPAYGARLWRSESCLNGRVAAHPSPSSPSPSAPRSSSPPPPVAAAEYEGREIAPDSPGASWVRSDWERDLLGATLPLLTFEPLGREGLEYWVEARVKVGGEDASFTLGPWTPRAGESVEAVVEVPADVDLGPLPVSALGDFLVQVVVVDAESGVEFARESAPRLYFIADADGTVRLLDEEEAAVEAPYGLVGATAEDLAEIDELAARLSAEGAIIERVVRVEPPR